MTEKKKCWRESFILPKMRNCRACDAGPAIYATSLMRPMKMKNRAGGKSFEVCSDISGAIPGIHPSFHCDYGFPIRAGDNFMPITIASFWMSAR